MLTSRGARGLRARELLEFAVTNRAACGITVQREAAWACYCGEKVMRDASQLVQTVPRRLNGFGGPTPHGPGQRVAVGTIKHVVGDAELVDVMVIEGQVRKATVGTVVNRANIVRTG